MRIAEYLNDKHCSPHTDTTCDTAPQSPSLNDVHKNEAINGFTSSTSKDSNLKKNSNFLKILAKSINSTNNNIELNGKDDHLNDQVSAENFPDFSNFLELDKARNYCQCELFKDGIFWSGL